MRNKILTSVIVLYLGAFSILAQTATVPTGSGSEENPYQISNLENLYWLSQTSGAWGSCFVQTADIDASETQTWDNGNGFTPLGNSLIKFTGNYNGKGYKISNLHISRSDENYVGFFGYTNTAKLDSLHLKNCSVTGERIIGGLVGYMDYGETKNSIYYGNVSAGYYVGGLVGYSRSASITMCYSSGNVSGEYYIGGLIGMTQTSSVSNCFSSSNVSGVNYSGGFIGQNSYNTTLIDCYATGSVYGAFSTGGFAGINIFTSSIQNCYSIGKVFGGDNLGGFIGLNRASLTNCYFNTENSGQSEGIGDDNQGQTVSGLTSVQMKSEANFTGYDFSSTWLINDGESFPSLQSIYDLPIILDDLSHTVNLNEPYIDTLHIIPMEIGINTIILINYPTGMELTNDSILSWIPDAVGVYTYSIKITDSNSISFTVTNEIVVTSYPGDGSESAPYQVTNIEDLNLMRELPDKHFILMNDLDFSGSAFDSTTSSEGWSPIGTNVLKFTGSFNGNGYSIANLFINRPEEDYVGLFGYTQNATIKNIALDNGSITGNKYVGSIAGYIKETDISICYSSCSVSGDWATGGLIGYFFTGSVSNCYITGNVAGTEKVGGLVGYNQNGEINYCYATGRVFGHVEAGSLVGFNNDDITDSYFNTETSAQTLGLGKESSGNTVLTGLTTNQMKYASSFSGFDFGSIWKITEGISFPRLQALYNAPVILQDISKHSKLNETITDTLRAISMDNNVVSFSLISYPDGMKLTNDSIITWIPDTTGKCYFSIKATDNQGIYTTTYFEIIVTSFNGEGTDESPYQITSINELSQVQFFPEKHFVLMNNLDFANTQYDSTNSAEGWEPICSYTSPFKGYFNGSGYTINNLYVNRTNKYSVGLFGEIDEGTVENLGVTNGYINASGSVGGIIGHIEIGRISNCYYSGCVTGEEIVGGVVGDISNGTINNCYSTATIQGEQYIGSLLGAIYDGSVSNCYATGLTTGNSFVGGLAGYNENGTISECYATGKVSGTINTGGLVGYNENAVVSNSYFNLETTEQAEGIGTDENSQVVTGLTTTQMKQDSSFTGFNFDTVWAIRADKTYPALKDVNNAPFAFADTITGSLQAVLNNDYDYETLQDNLVCRFDSIIIKQSGQHYSAGSSTISTGDTLLVSYQVGEYNNTINDTLWGNRATSILLYENHAPVITSTAPLSAAIGKEYIYEITATDEDGDVLIYSLSNAPDGMVIKDNSIVSWVPDSGTVTSGEVTLIVSDMDLTDNEIFTISIETNESDRNSGEEFTLYPNPVLDAFQITGFNGTAILHLYNSFGTLLITKEVTANDYISTNNLSSGIYVVKIYYSNKSITKPFIKIK